MLQSEVSNSAASVRFTGIKSRSFWHDKIRQLFSPEILQLQINIFAENVCWIYSSSQDQKGVSSEVHISSLSLNNELQTIYTDKYWLVQDAAICWPGVWDLCVRSCVDCNFSTSVTSVDMKLYRYFLLCLSIVREDITKWYNTRTSSKVPYNVFFMFVKLSA